MSVRVTRIADIQVMALIDSCSLLSKNSDL